MELNSTSQERIQWDFCVLYQKSFFFLSPSFQVPTPLVTPQKNKREKTGCLFTPIGKAKLY